MQTYSQTNRKMANRQTDAQKAREEGRDKRENEITFNRYALAIFK